MPFVSPTTVCEIDVLPALLSVPPAGCELTVYPEIALPPVFAGGTKETPACALPAMARTLVGGSGTVGITDSVVLWNVVLNGLTAVPTVSVVVVVVLTVAADMCLTHTL